jgi:hypothetical protein
MEIKISDSLTHFLVLFFVNLENRHSKHATMQLFLWILTSFTSLVTTTVHGDVEAFV